MRLLAVLLALSLVGTGACKEARTVSHSKAPESSLKADRPEHDFGRVPIDGGKVETLFDLVNEAPGEVQLLSVATSCGCTEAVAEFADGSTVGSFDLPNDGQENDAGRKVSAGESFKVRVAFDPAAHGPDAVGELMREVILATRDGGQTRLVIRANVVRVADPHEGGPR
jgi:hypothetical protein